LRRQAVRPARAPRIEGRSAEADQNRLVNKIKYGYEIESRTDTMAILVAKGRWRWFGLFGSDTESRHVTSVDAREHTRTCSVRARELVGQVGPSLPAPRPGTHRDK
jgi:hypothetical protein